MITISEMRQLEDSCGIPKVELMEYAGKGIFDILNEKFDLKDKKVLVVAYHGNNGGDGFVAARYLADIATVDIAFLGDEEKLKEEGQSNYNKIYDNPVIQFLDMSNVHLDEYDIIIDALLGIGIQGQLKPEIFNAIELINNARSYTVSVDIPSGMNPDTGEIHDKAVDADLVITFHDIKKGLRKIKDRVKIVDIGIKK